MYNNVYDDYGYNSYNQKPKFSLKNLTLKGKILFGLILLVVFIIGLIVFNKIQDYYDSYAYFEKIMVENAQKYVKNNNMLITDEIYLGMSTLGMDTKDSCSQFSGVIVDNKNNYQPYLLCEEYRTNVFPDNPNYHLNGEEVLLLAKGISYVEVGVYNDYQYSVQGSVGTEEGIYNLTYVVKNNEAILGTLNRKVIVVDDPYIKSMFPSLTLLGNSTEYVEKGHSYVDKGVVASDSVDLDITSSVLKNGTVDINRAGEYEIIYTVTNSRGYSNSIIRKVVVVNSFSTTVVTATLNTKNPTNQDVIVTLNVNGNNFDYMILPNNNRTSDKIIQYIVHENGIYNFFSYDKDGKVLTKIVMVDNIDKTPPTGSCIAEIYSQYTNITVTQTSSKKISGYNYNINGVKSDYIGTSTYRRNVSNATYVSVQIKDSINNVATISCKLDYKDPTIGNNKVKYYRAFNSEYVTPNISNDLDTFVKLVRNKISQNADEEECGSACLSFSQYHAYVLQYGNMRDMDLYDACHYKHADKVRVVYTGTDDAAKKEALRLIYNEIFNGRVIVIQITGNAKKNSRHFGLVVGYRRNVYSADQLREEDLIYIDSWGGNLRTLDPVIDSDRIMFNDKSRGGWRVDILR